MPQLFLPTVWAGLNLPEALCFSHALIFLPTTQHPLSLPSVLLPSASIMPNTAFPAISYSSRIKSLSFFYRFPTKLEANLQNHLIFMDGLCSIRFLFVTFFLPSLFAATPTSPPCSSPDLTKWDKMFSMLENSQMRENMLLQYADDIIKVEMGSLRNEMIRLV